MMCAYKSLVANRKTYSLAESLRHRLAADINGITPKASRQCPESEAGRRSCTKGGDAQKGATDMWVIGSALVSATWAKHHEINQNA